MSPRCLSPGMGTVPLVVPCGEAVAAPSPRCRRIPRFSINPHFHSLCTPIWAARGHGACQAAAPGSFCSFPALHQARLGVLGELFGAVAGREDRRGQRGWSEEGAGGWAGSLYPASLPIPGHPSAPGSQGRAAGKGRAAGMRQEERTHGHASPQCSPPVTPGLQSSSARLVPGEDAAKRCQQRSARPARRSRGMRSSRRSRESPLRCGRGTGTLTDWGDVGFRV